jgi:hypothetical protein
LQTAAFTFEIIHPTNPKSGDLELKIKMQSFTANLSKDSEDKHHVLPIWIFWYKPSNVILESMAKTRKQGDNICLFLYENPSTIDDAIANNNPIFALKSPSRIDKNLEKEMKSLTDQLCEHFEGWIK